MRGVVAVAAALLVSVGASGCFVAEDDPETQGDSAGDGTTSRTGTAGPGPSSATTTWTGTAPAGAAGSAPVVVNFTANATGLDVTFTFTGTDAENGTISWTLSFGDNASANGTLAAPANGTGPAQASANHTYASEGAYNATLTLSDGASSVNQTITVTVAAAAAGGPPMEPITMSGSCTMDTKEHAVDVLPGQAFMRGTISPGPTGVDLDWAFLDPSGAEKDAGGDFDPIDGGEGDLEVLTPVAGTWTVEVTCFIGAAASYEFTLTFQ